MATYILTWNHTRWEWPNFEAAVRSVQAGKPCYDTWSTGQNKRFQPGDQFFLFRLHDHQGIIGSGIVTSTVYQDSHWDGSDREANFAGVEFHRLVTADETLRVAALIPAVPVIPWKRLQASGITVPIDQKQTLERLWLDHLEKLGLTDVELPDEIADPSRFTEGSTLRICVNAYERSSAARKACIDHYGTSCVVCGFDFARTFGKLGESYIHVHHILDLASIGKEYKVHPVNDLRPVCPNCHAMLHQETPAMTIEKLKTIIESCA